MLQDWTQTVTVSHCMGELLDAASAKFLELGGLARGHHVLDLACGVGSLAGRAAQVVAGNGGGVLGIDTCPEMIDAALRIHAGNGAVRFAVHDVHHPVGQPDSYDAVFCRFSLPFLDNPAVALARSLEALKPGGRMCIMSIADFEHNELIRVLDATRSPFVDHVLHWGNQEAIAYQLEAVGYRNVLTKRIRALVTVTDPAAYWSCMRGLFGFADPAPPRSVVERVPPGTRLQVSLVFAIGHKHDPAAVEKREVLGAEDLIALARRRAREISPTSLAQTFKGEHVVYLDVRPPATRVSKIKDSVNLTRDDLEKHLPSMIPDPATAIVVYCQNGNQSALAAGQLRAMGYTNVWSLQRGIAAWEYVGMRVVPV